MIYQFTMFVRIALFWPPRSSMANVSHITHSLWRQTHVSMSHCSFVLSYFKNMYTAKFFTMVMIQHNVWSTGQNPAFWLWNRWRVAKKFWPSNIPIECIDFGLSHLTWLAGQLPVSSPIINAQKTNVFPFLARKSTQIHPSHPASPLDSDITCAYWTSRVHLSNSLWFINIGNPNILFGQGILAHIKYFHFSHLKVQYTVWQRMKFTFCLDIKKNCMSSYYSLLNA